MCLFCLKGATRGNKSNGVEVTIISSFPEGIAPLTDIVTVPPPSSFDEVLWIELFLPKYEADSTRGRLKEEMVGRERKRCRDNNKLVRGGYWARRGSLNFQEARV